MFFTSRIVKPIICDNAASTSSMLGGGVHDSTMATCSSVLSRTVMARRFPIRRTAISVS